MTFNADEERFLREAVIEFCKRGRMTLRRRSVALAVGAKLDCMADLLQIPRVRSTWARRLFKGGER